MLQNRSNMFNVGSDYVTAVPTFQVDMRRIRDKKKLALDTKIDDCRYVLLLRNSKEKTMRFSTIF